MSLGLDLWNIWGSDDAALMAAGVKPSGTDSAGKPSFTWMDKAKVLPTSAWVVDVVAGVVAAAKSWLIDAGKMGFQSVWMKAVLAILAFLLGTIYLIVFGAYDVFGAWRSGGVSGGFSEYFSDL